MIPDDWKRRIRSGGIWKDPEVLGQLLILLALLTVGAVIFIFAVKGWLVGPQSGKVS